MSGFVSNVSLKEVLRFDGVLCLVMAAALIALRNVISGPTGLPAGFLAVAGMLLLPIGLYILAVASAAAPSRLGTGTVVIGNVLWVLASLAVIAGGFVEPATLGVVLILVQAAGVAAIAAAEALLMKPQIMSRA